MAAPKRRDKIESPEAALQVLGERLRRAAFMPNIYGYTPHVKQDQFHQSTKRRKLYIGGNRSGKTTGGVCEDIWWLTGEHPNRPDVNEIARTVGTRGRVIGTDFSNGVEKTLIPQFKQWLPPSKLVDGSWEESYDKVNRTLYLDNGSFIEFMSYDQDLDKFAGTSRHFIHFDEEPPEGIYTENVARLVDTGGSLWMTMTPVEGMTWVFDTIYEPGILGSDKIEVVEVDMTDNPHLNSAEVQDFLESLSEDEQKARIHGKFVQMGGLVYKTFNPKPGGMHVLNETQVPPADWLWVVSLDHGFNNPTAVLWHAVSPDGRLLTFHEHYQNQWTIDMHAEKIHAVNRQFKRQPDFYIADPSIRNTDPITGTSIHQEYIKFGLAFTFGNNDVSAGLVRVNRYMKPKRDGVPMWRITPNCVSTIKELSRYRWKTYSSKKLQSENNPFDAPHKKDDHACDSLRYFIMSRPDLVQTADEIVDKVMRPLDAPQASRHDGHMVADPTGRIERQRDGGLLIPEAATTSSWEFDEHLGGYW